VGDVLNGYADLTESRVRVLVQGTQLMSVFHVTTISANLWLWVNAAWSSGGDGHAGEMLGVNPGIQAVVR